MSYIAILAGAGAALGFGISDYLAVKPLRELGYYRVTAYLLLFSTLTILPFLFYTGLATHASGFILALAALMSLLLFAGFILTYRSFIQGNLSINATIAGSYPALTVVVAVLFLGDKLTTGQIAPLVAVLLGVVLVSTKFSGLKAKKKLVAKGVENAMVASVIFSITSLFSGVYTAIVGFALMSIMGRSIGSASGFVASYATKQDLRPPKRKLLIQIILAGIMDAFGVLCWLYGVYVAPSNLPIVVGVAGFAGGVSVICALIALRERPEPKQWIGIALTVLGVIALALFS